MDLDHGYSDVDTALHGEERAVHKSKAVSLLVDLCPHPKLWL